MEEYKLELKQVVDYPRCRMYRQFVLGIVNNKNLRIGGESHLYYYTVLCCFANFRTSYHRVKSVTYTLYPGEWICKIEDIMKWFRVRNKRQVMDLCVDTSLKRIMYSSIPSLYVPDSKNTLHLHLKNTRQPSMKTHMVSSLWTIW